jgi:hypothetical protein
MDVSDNAKADQAKRFAMIMRYKRLISWRMKPFYHVLFRNTHRRKESSFSRNDDFHPDQQSKASVLNRRLRIKYRT